MPINQTANGGLVVIQRPGKYQNRKNVGGYLDRLVKWIFGIFKKPIRIMYDGRCDCDCFTLCPIGKVGAEERCTYFELLENNIKIKKSI